MEAAPLADRPFHVRSNSTPPPLSEPWAAADTASLIPSSVSLMIPCTGDASCGFAEALEGFFPLDGTTQEYEDAQDRAFEMAHAPTLSTLTPNKSSSGSLCSTGTPPRDDSLVVVVDDCDDERESPATPKQVTPVTPPTYQKRGRFLVWPVNMEAPQLSLPFFGLTPQ